MIKKRLLFLHFDMRGGGAEKVLVNLLNGLNKDKYDITLYLLFKTGVNLDKIDSDIHIKYLFKRSFRGLTFLLKMFSPYLLHKLLIHNHYDAEISYLEYSPTRIVSGCENQSTKLIAWVHSRIDSLSGVYRSMDELKKCYSKFNKVVFVADEARTVFMNKTKLFRIQTEILPNVIEYDKVLSLSKEVTNLELDSNVVNICVVGKLYKSKGAVRIAEILCNLYKGGVKKWHLYYLGIGNGQDDIEKCFLKNDIIDHVTFLGYQSNPYKYISKMSLFVCPSYSEGYSTSTIEAFILGIPVLVTDCGGMRQITHDGEYGMLVPNSDDGISEGLKVLICDNAVLAKYKKLSEVRSSFFRPEVALSQTENLIDSLWK